MILSKRIVCLTLLFVGLAASSALAAGAATQSWHTDYTKAVQSAKEQGKYLFIFFHETGNSAVRDAFESRVLAQSEVQARLAGFERVRLPLDASIYIGGKLTRLLDHPSFSEMQRQQGIAILDFAAPGSAHYGLVVNMFPFRPGRYYGVPAVKTILSLPSGTLTQRTMIYAVRMHPEHPASTRGEFNPILANEAESHSHHQANIRVQGHHRWGYRFQRILGRLRYPFGGGGGGGPTEVVAESWPGKTLVDAAVDCVDSWRQSSGHWDAVRSDHGAYAYDMKRGSNGIWYATGIFAGYRRR